MGPAVRIGGWVKIGWALLALAALGCDLVTPFRATSTLDAAPAGRDAAMDLPRPAGDLPDHGIQAERSPDLVQRPPDAVVDAGGDLLPDQPSGDLGPCGETCAADEVCTPCGCLPSAPRICVAGAGHAVDTVTTTINDGASYAYGACALKVADIFANQFACGTPIPGGVVVLRQARWGLDCTFLTDVCP